MGTPLYPRLFEKPGVIPRSDDDCGSFSFGMDGYYKILTKIYANSKYVPIPKSSYMLDLV